MTRDELIAWCRTRGAYVVWLDWLATLSASATLADAWEACDRGDWLLSIAVTAGIERCRIVEAACDCAETALVHVPPGEARPARAIASARAWARGEGTAAAADRAAAASADAAAASVVNSNAAAYAAARAACAAAYAAAYAAARADVYAANAYAAARAAAYADAYAANDYAADAVAAASALAQHASLVRGRISAADVEAAMEAAR